MPISSHWRRCVHPSLISTLEPAFKFLIASTPATKSCNLPLKRAIKIENDVNGIVSGVNSSTRSKACESQITIFGGYLRELIIAGNSSVWHTSAKPL